MASAFIAPRWRWGLFWLAVVLAAAYFLVDSVTTIATDYSRADFEWTVRQASATIHFGLALPILLLGPLQFSGTLRRRRPRLHRRLGTVFLVASLAAGLLAIYLGFSIRFTGSRIPLVLFGTLWVMFNLIAWQAARRRDFQTHQRFVVRGIALALAFVWVRLMGMAEESLFGFMTENLRGTTREWLSFVIPLVAVESGFTWWPAARRVFAPAR